MVDSRTRVRSSRICAGAIHDFGSSRADSNLRKTLVDERTAWQQRLQAQLFHRTTAKAPSSVVW
jgi:hypothetical protein